MNIIILKDLKGFTKIIEVARFPHEWKIAIKKPIRASLGEGEADMVAPKVITFRPFLSPKDVDGTKVWVYKQDND